MSEVALPIGGKIYRVACAPGEEDHVAALGAVINDKLASMGNLSGHEAQNLLFAALLLADEVHESRGTASGPRGDVVAAEALAETAAGERDELKAALANRDAEFEQLQTAHDDARKECEATRERLAEVSERLAERQANEAALLARIEELSAVPGQPGGTAPAPDTDLAPALESLAEMLEQTADKLERAGRAS